MFENVYMCTYTCVYRQAHRQRMIPEGGANEISRQHLRMSEERWEKACPRRVLLGHGQRVGVKG